MLSVHRTCRNVKEDRELVLFLKKNLNLLFFAFLTLNNRAITTTCNVLHVRTLPYPGTTYYKSHSLICNSIPS